MISEFTHFNLIIRLSKVEQLAMFRFSPCWLSMCWTTGRRVASFLSAFTLSVDRQHSFLDCCSRVYWQLQHEISRHRTCLQVWWLLLFGRWWGSIVHVIHLNTDSRLWGWNENRGPRALSRLLHDLWMHPSSTSSPWVPYFMCSRVLLPPGRFGPLRAEVGVGFRRVRLVQALLSSPPPLVLFRCPSASAFLFPCLFRVCPFRARCVVLVFSLSLFFCVPLFASWLSNFHLIFIFTSSSFPFFFIFISSYRALIVPPSCGRVCVCVWTIWKDVKLLLLILFDFILFHAGGQWISFHPLPNEDGGLRLWYLISGLIIPTYLQISNFHFVVNGNRLSPEPACRSFAGFLVLLHCCRNLYFSAVNRGRTTWFRWIRCF